jgi:hypothetical protein
MRGPLDSGRRFDLLILLVIAASVVVGLLVFAARDQRRWEELRTARAGEGLQEYLERLPTKGTDLAVARGVFESLSQRMPGPPGFPVRPEDDLEGVYRIDQGELEIVAEEVASSTGRSLASTTANPFVGRVHTVRDLVGFLSNQPRVQDSPPV